MKIDSDNMARWVLAYDLGVILAATFKVREVSGWWENNMNAATIMNKIMERYGVQYTGKHDHTHQTSAVSILISNKNKQSGSDVLADAVLVADA